jgi:hypothetical protein
MPKYRAKRPGYLNPPGHECCRRVAANEIFEWSGVPGSWMAPLDDEARARTTEAKQRKQWSGLPHRLGGGGDPVQPGQTKVASPAQP